MLGLENWTAGISELVSLCAGGGIVVGGAGVGASGGAAASAPGALGSGATPTDPEAEACIYVTQCFFHARYESHEL